MDGRRSAAQRRLVVRVLRHQRARHPRGRAGRAGRACPTPLTPPGPAAWALSARSTEALGEQARRLLAFTEDHPQVGGVPIGAELALRPVHTHRAVVVGTDTASCADALRALAAGGTHDALRHGTATAERTAFVFPGQGAQWDGMGIELAASSQAFAERLSECAVALSEFVDWSLLDVLRGEPGAPGYDRVDVVQPALWAVMVSLAAAWEAHGVTPSVVIGHSQGEIAAACVAGALTLRDAARVVALRSRAIGGLAGDGGMLAVSLREDEATDAIAGRAGLSLAVANSPRSVVVSGDATALDVLAAELETAGVRTHRINVDYASHSAHVERIEAQLLELLAPIEPQPSRVPFFSTVDGGYADTTGLDAAYWYRNLRSTVRFADAVRAVAAETPTAFVELSPHPVLALPMQQTIEAIDADATSAVIGSLHRDDGGLPRFLLSVAEAFVAGADARVAGPDPAPRVTLPTYPFADQRYWLKSGGGRADAGSLGLTGSTHPMLGAAVTLPDSDGVVFAGRLAADSQPWIVDHAVSGVLLLPGTAVLDLVAHAGAQLDRPGVADLTLEVPLVLPAQGGLQLRITVGADEPAGRTVTVHSRPEHADADLVWTRHATATVVVGRAPSAGRTVVWPPVDAEPVDLSGHYDALYDAGFEYGPAFHGLRAAWRRGDEVFGELVAPESIASRVGEHVLHPALLDAALHAIGIGGYVTANGGGVALPFAWSGVTVRRSADTALRVSMAPAGGDAVTISITDTDGTPVFEADSLALRHISAAALAGSARRGRDLYRLDWVAETLPESAGTEGTGGIAVLGADAFGLGAQADLLADVALTDVVVHDPIATLAAAGGPTTGAEAVHTVTAATLALLQAWLVDPRRSGSRLVVLTRGGVTLPGDTLRPDPVAAAVVGLVRTAATEYDGTFGLVDIDVDPTADGAEFSRHLLRDAVGSEIAQLALRTGTAHVPRLAAVDALPDTPVDWTAGSGAVLVTGGTGTLGGLVARHLAGQHGVRELVLVSRRGPAADGADELVRTLAELGAQATVVACDTADPEQVATLFAQHDIGSIVHSAGVLDDGLVDSLSAEQLHRVLRPKVDAAWNLHEATRTHPVRDFVLFSSAAGTFGGPGQANYAAANTYLDSLAALRRADGLPATSIAWGLWEQGSGMTGHLDERDNNRMAQSGVEAIPSDDGLRLFDDALSADEALLVGIRLDRGTLRQLAQDHALPPLLQGLVRGSVRDDDDGASSAQLLARLAGTDDRIGVLLDVVRAEVASTLGFASADDVAPTVAFREIGFDSLMAVQLRNRLGAVTGLRLPATLVFDHPSPTAVAALLDGELTVPDPGELALRGVLDGIAGLERAIAGLAIDDDNRSRITERLGELIAGAALTRAPADLRTQLEDASDEDVFSLLDEFGSN